MVRKQQLINNGSIIGVLRIEIEGGLLIYDWEYIPHSISSYLKYKFDSSTRPIWENTKINIIKRITFELTALMGYLATMRI